MVLFFILNIYIRMRSNHFYGILKNKKMRTTYIYIVNFWNPVMELHILGLSYYLISTPCMDACITFFFEALGTYGAW